MATSSHDPGAPHDPGSPHDPRSCGATCAVACSDDDGLAEALFTRVARLSRLSAREAATFDITIAQVRTLATLRDAGPLRVTDLATRESIAQPTMTQILRRLSGHGWVRRTPDPGDGRATRISLTEAGQDLLGRIRARATGVYSDRLGRLTDHERAALRAALPVLDRLLAAPESPPAPPAPSTPAGP